MRGTRWIAGPTLVVLLLLPHPTSAAQVSDERPDLLSRLPRDPLFVAVTSGENLAGTYDAMLDLFGRFGDEDDVRQFRAILADLDTKLGCSLRDDLLAGLGSDLAFVVDLPPVDQWMASMVTADAAATSMLGRIGLLTSVRETRRFEGCLRKLLGQAEGVAFLEKGELVEVRIPIDAGGGGDPDPTVASLPHASLFYAFRGDLFALGADPERVAASLEPRSAGQRVADGADFARVFDHLDADAERLTYLNLPKLRTMVESSALLQGIIGSDPEARTMVDLLLTPEFTATGLGTTAVNVDGGTRRTSFGPPALSGGTAMLGMIAATAIPNFLHATDRGRQKRSMADLRSAGTAIEMFALDTEAYPSSEGLWIPLTKLEVSLAPAYIRRLPEVDGWGHPLMYWSDGTQYRLTSPGRDGEMSRDWSAPIERGATSSFDADIVFADGQFVAWPEGQQR